MEFHEMVRKGEENRIKQYGAKAVKAFKEACEQYQLELANHRNVAVALARDEILGAQPSPPPTPPKIEDFV